MSKQEITGFALAPLIVAVPLAVTFGLIAYAQRDIQAFIEATSAIVLLSYGATLIFGLPIHLLMRRMGRTGLGAYLVASIIAVFLVSIATTVASQLIPPSAEDNPHSLLHIWSRLGLSVTLGFAFLALLTAGTFWGVAVRHREI